MNILLPPDSLRYLHLAGGGGGMKPFNMRWLIPSILGVDVNHWLIASTIMLVLTIPLLYFYLKGFGLDSKKSFFGCLLYTSLPFIPSLFHRPVLLDSYLMVGALIVSNLLVRGYRKTGYLLLLPLMLVKENMGILVFVYTLDFIPVLYTIIPFLLAQTPSSTDLFHGETPPWLGADNIINHLKYSWWRLHKTLLPWNICLTGFLKPSMHLAVALSYGYATMLVGGLDSRYFLIVCPVVILHALRFLSVKGVLSG